MATQKSARALRPPDTAMSMRRYLVLMGKFKLTLTERLTLSALFVGIILLISQLMVPKTSANDGHSPDLPGASRVESLLGMDELA